MMASEHLNGQARCCRLGEKKMTAQHALDFCREVSLKICAILGLLNLGVSDVDTVEP